MVLSLIIRLKLSKTLIILNSFVRKLLTVFICELYAVSHLVISVICFKSRKHLSLKLYSLHSVYSFSSWMTKSECSIQDGDALMNCKARIDSLDKCESQICESKNFVTYFTASIHSLALGHQRLLHFLKLNRISFVAYLLIYTTYV